MSKKLSPVDSRLLDFHKNQIIKELHFKHEPVVFYGDEACAYVRKNVPKYHGNTDKQILSKANGYFHYENLPHEYIKTGVVCIFTGKISTLAHELRHAKQFQDNDKWLQRGVWLNRFLFWGYGLYPAEKEAFQFAFTYLLKSKLYKSASFYGLRIFIALFFDTKILWPITLFVFFPLLIWLILKLVFWLISLFL